jgi:ABC-type transport system involved in Fe-S cluster assembly fused permease/ATPase subunit
MLRASYSISAPTLQRFNAAVPQGERSRVMERYMQLALQEKEREFAAIADAYMTDPAFAMCRSDELMWDITIGDGLENL